MPTENRSSNTEQMVSVPRDEVERLVKLLQYQAHPYPSPHAEFWQGLLDTPAGKHQSEQVYQIRSHGSCCWEDIAGESLELCQAQPAEYEVRKLYLHPPTSDG